ncbi:hypothetical protein DB91_02040 [Ehrlichia sp. Wisconsin_h]|uniref:Uncharacterized protein n=2 Tax=Anaplasmataceae TaxID=942 RepID=A0A0F3N901_9RICK|nr:hypothetical protein EMUCRT_0863 [Ehrlichia cf. muris str. EmCRT]OUC04549.1 hypothetical protein DB91_02040 [Ehrlichia sp. Wisconsin_h]
MSVCVFSLIRRVICIFIFIFYMSATCAFGYKEISNKKPSGYYGPLTFLDYKVKLTTCISSIVTINAGECKFVEGCAKRYIAYVDNRSFLRPSLCLCIVSSCEGLPNHQSEWVSRCDFNPECENISTRLFHVPFCPVIFEDKNIMRFVPIEFSRQTFFKPGIRLIVVDDGNLYKEDFFLSDDDFFEGKECKAAFAGKLYEFKLYRSGGDKICVYYYDKGEFLIKCFPIPVLSQPVLRKYRIDKVGIQFSNTLLKPGNHVDDNIMREFNINIIRPKINFKNHGFYLSTRCKDGVLLKPNEYCQNGISEVQYKHDDAVMVKCVDIRTIFGYVLKFHTDQGERHIWLKPLPYKMMHYVRIEGRYKQCPDGEYDIASKKQDFLDNILINEDDYYINSDKQNSIGEISVYPGHHSCNNIKDSCYLYQNILEYTKPPKLFSRAFPQFVQPNRFDVNVIKYFNVDYREILSLDKSLQSKLQPLDYHSMGMCIDDFGGIIYTATKGSPYDKSSSAMSLKYNRAIKGKRHVYELLYDPKLQRIYNVPGKCDFVKIEVWGGGQPGKIDVERWRNEEGQPGGYVMGMFRLRKSRKYFIKVDFQGIHRPIDNNNGDIGADTIVDFCGIGRHGKVICKVKLTASGGGGKLQNNIKEMVKINSNVNQKEMLYYRVVDNSLSRRSENVPNGKRIRFIPYQNFMTEMFWEEIGQNDCKSGQLLAENNSAYFGTGGCADVNTNSTEEGANGMVRITCETWSNR